MKLMLFSAPWCGQCKVYHSTVDKFVKKNPQIEFEEVNVDENEDVVSKYKVQSLPTTIVVNNGDEVARATGIINFSQLKNLFKDL